jgi:hypothetical protein
MPDTIWRSAMARLAQHGLIHANFNLELIDFPALICICVGMSFDSSSRPNKYETVYVTVDKMAMKLWRLTRVRNAVCRITALDLPPESAANKIDKIGMKRI